MNNTKVAFLLILIIIAIIAILILKKRQKEPAIKQIEANTVWPFHAVKPLSQPEQVLYHRLVSALPDCIILAQVQLSRILRVDKGFNYNEYNNRINRKSLDFVICNKDASIIAVIELDDKSHEREDRKYADRNKDKALESANIKVIRWKVNSMPNVEEIRKLLV